MRTLSTILAAALVTAVSLGASPAVAAPPLWSDVSITDIDGRDLASTGLQDKVVLVVNVASFCSYTDQYADLQLLQDRYAEQGLVVMGVPCNQFGGQEPGSAKEIKNFCSSRYGITFPLLAKQDVNGPTRSPLYDRLVGSGKDVGWNFEKFLVGRNGQVVARFGSHVTPRDPTFRAAIELALARDPAPSDG